MTDVRKDIAFYAVINASLALAIGSFLSLLALIPLANSFVDYYDEQRLQIKECQVLLSVSLPSALDYFELV